VQYGTASWYGKKFHGRRTANGEVFDMYQLTAAHKSVPLGIHAIVTNMDTGRSVRVRVNDRGPFVGNRILDLSYAAARRLDMVETGLAWVKIQFLPETIPATAFIVQAGAFRDRTNAVQAHKALATQYSRVWITAASEDSYLFYRVRLGPFTSRAAAERTAHQARARGYPAKVVPFPHPPATLRRSADKL
jgi:rare lipoprotein A